MPLQLYAAPMQGLTDYRFRNAFARHFGCIDNYYAPYIRPESERSIKPAVQRDIQPDNNRNLVLTPQVMSRKADEMLWLANYLQELGYSEMDWNLGCPYPMVAKRGLGSGLLQEPELIAEILHELTNKTQLTISVKMRLGYEDAKEILQILPLLNDIPLKHIAIHPRIGKQMYKGEVDLDAFAACAQLSRHLLVYNGDIHSYKQFQVLQQRFPTLGNWMLGRGLLYNPFLPQQIKEQQAALPDDWKNTFTAFLKELTGHFAETLSGDKHLLQRMYSYWEYFIALFPEDKRTLRSIKKARNSAEYWQALQIILR